MSCENMVIVFSGFRDEKLKEQIEEQEDQGITEGLRRCDCAEAQNTAQDRLQDR